MRRLKMGSRKAPVRVPDESRGAGRWPKPGDWLEEHRPTSYWTATRRPFPSLLLVAPLVIAYEWAVIWLGGATPGKLRTGADTWMRNALASLGVDDRWLLPLLLVVILLGWQVVSYRDWRFSPGILAGMVVESLVWAVMLVGISRLIDAGFSYLEQRGTGVLAIEPGKDDAVRLLVDRLRGRRRLRRNAVPIDPGARFLLGRCDCCRPPRFSRAPWPSPVRRCSSRWLTTREARASRSPGSPSSFAGWPASSSPGCSSCAASGSPSARTRSTISWWDGSPARLLMLDRMFVVFVEASVRIVHLSDIHFWRYAFHPLRLLSKRLLGTASLFLGRGRRFRLERVPELIERVRSLDADHLLITGDLTTTALPGEFHHARTALSALLHDPAKVTIIPGNHDRYTLRAHRSRRFEHYFGAFAPDGPVPLAAAH